MYLERSEGDTLLSIGIRARGYTWGRFSDYKDVLTEHLGRIERLSISRDTDRDHFVTHSIPLELTEWISQVAGDTCAARKLWQLHMKFSPDAPAFPKALRVNLAHLPRIFDLHSCLVKLDSHLPNPSFLTNVNLSWSKITFLDIIDFLTAVPTLKAAYFGQHHALRVPRSQKNLEPHLPLLLPNLSKLQLGSSSDIFAEQILRRIQCTTSCEITLLISEHTLVSDDYKEEIFLDCLPHSLHATFRSSISLHVHCTPLSKIIEFGSHSAVLPVLEFQSLHSPYYRVAFEEIAYGDEAVEESRPLFDDLSSIANAFGQLVTARISLKCLPDANAIRRCFAAFTHVERLVVRTRGASLSFLFRALGAHPSKSVLPLVPALRVLDIRQSRFEIDELKGFLSYRNSQGRMIERLQLTIGSTLDHLSTRKPSVNQQMLGEIEKEVGELEAEEGEWASDTDEDSEGNEDTYDDDEDETGDGILWEDIGNVDEEDEEDEDSGGHEEEI